jgi:tetratricopeptide (TPR) repeat protein
LHYAFALSGLGGIYHGQGNYQRAAQYTRQSIAVVERSPERDDGALSIDYSNLGKTLSYQGDFDGAERAYEHAVQLAKSTYGMDSWYYWVAAGNYAQTVHLRGDLERSRRMFDALLPLLPKDAAKYRNALEENSTARVLELYGSCLSAEGRPQLAIPLLKVAEQGYAEAPTYYYDLNHVRGELGLAYDRLGDTEDARRLLKSALDGYLATAPPDDPGVLQHREAWGAFVLRHGDLTEAGQQLREVLTQAHNRNLFSVALAHGELALLAVLQHDVPAALESSARAVDVFTNVTGFRDVRMGPYLWRIRAEVLLNAGDAAGARSGATRAGCRWSP